MRTKRELKALKVLINDLEYEIDDLEYSIEQIEDRISYHKADLQKTTKELQININKLNELKEIELKLKEK